MSYRYGWSERDVGLNLAAIGVCTLIVQAGLMQPAVIAELIGPGLFTLTFAYSIGAYREWHHPGAAFLLGALMLACAMALAWRITRPRRAAQAPHGPLD